MHTQTLVDVSLGTVEIPLDSPDWAQSMQLAARAFGDRALIGAGTVLRPEDANLMVAAGGKLVVTPNTHTPVIRTTAQVEPVTCVGCMAATEAFTVLDAGAWALRIFPASALGPGYMYALRVMLPTEVPVFAVGSITPENLADYLTAGCTDAGLGSDPYRPGQPVECTAKRACAFVTAYRNTQSDRT